MKKYIQKILRGIKAFFTSKFPSFETRVNAIVCNWDESDIEAIVENVGSYSEWTSESNIYDIVDDRLESKNEFDIGDYYTEIIDIVSSEEYLPRMDIESMIDEKVEGLLHEDDFEDSLRNYGHLTALIKREIQEYLSKNYSVRFILDDTNLTS